MTKTRLTQAQQQQDLEQRFWAMAESLRGDGRSGDYRNDVLGLVCYWFLSEKVATCATELLAGQRVTYAETSGWDEERRQALQTSITKTLGFYIAPQSLYASLLQAIRQGNFALADLQAGLVGVQVAQLNGLFKDVDLTSSLLGKNEEQRQAMVAKALLQLVDLPYDVRKLNVGNAYENLIMRFALASGRRSGEFYTPQAVSQILAGMLAHGHQHLTSVYDPTMGSGSLLLHVGMAVPVDHYYGQEIDETTYNLARMNLLMHDVGPAQFDVALGDTLVSDQFDGKAFDAVVANPPYAARWDSTGELTDKRFQRYGVTAPKSKADFAFLEHMLYHLQADGTMAVVVPHGVLFRGAAEGKIRRQMIETDNVLDAVIGLPANLFYASAIPTVILVFKKNRTRSDVLFVDASKTYEKGRGQNQLTAEQVQRIVQAYADWQDVAQFSHVAALTEIAENDYNLSIPRYVDTFVGEPTVDVDQVKADLQQTTQELAQTQAEFAQLMNELTALNQDKSK